MRTIKSIAVLLIFFGIVSLYWKSVVSDKKALLMAIAEPFNIACQSNDGCIVKPDGWSFDYHYGYYKEDKFYKAKNEQFEISWKIATGVTLVVKGGKNQQVTVIELFD